MSDKLSNIKAVVKWFNPFKGYGFVNIEGLSEDVFLHFSVLNQCGIQLVNINDTLTCDVSFSDEKGYFVSHIYHRELSRDTELCINKKAVIKWFNPFKGYGFASDEDNNDILIHSSVLRNFGIKNISTGMVMNLVVTKTHKGYEAKAILQIL